MTPDNALAALKGQLGNWTSTNIDAWCFNEMNAAVRRLQDRPTTPWFLFADTEEEGTNLVTVSGEETVDLPTDFLREQSEGIKSALMWSNPDANDSWTPILKKDYSYIKTRYTASGDPVFYDILGTKIYLRYIPDDVFTLRLLYWKKDAVITAGSTETLFLLHVPDLVIAEAGQVIAGQYLKDDKAEARFQRRAQQENALLTVNTIAKQEANRPRMMGEA